MDNSFILLGEDNLEDTAWIAITAIAIVGIIALVLVFNKQQPSVESGVSYVYDDKNRLQGIMPMQIKLREVD